MARAAVETRASSASAHPLTRIFQFPPLGEKPPVSSSPPLPPYPRRGHGRFSLPPSLFSQAQERKARKDGSMSLNAAASNIFLASSL